MSYATRFKMYLKLYNTIEIKPNKYVILNPMKQ